jgi:hypothetical protein
MSLLNRKHLGSVCWLEEAFSLKNNAVRKFKVWGIGTFAYIIEVPALIEIGHPSVV